MIQLLTQRSTSVPSKIFPQFLYLRSQFLSISSPFFSFCYVLSKVSFPVLCKESANETWSEVGRILEQPWLSSRPFPDYFQDPWYFKDNFLSVPFKFAIKSQFHFWFLHDSSYSFFPESNSTFGLSPVSCSFLVVSLILVSHLGPVQSKIPTITPVLSPLSSAIFFIIYLQISSFTSNLYIPRLWFCAKIIIVSRSCKLVHGFVHF